MTKEFNLSEKDSDKWKCPNCEHERKYNKKMLMVWCRCGHYMKEVRGKNVSYNYKEVSKND